MRNPNATVKIQLSGKHSDRFILCDERYARVLRQFRWYGLAAHRSRTIYARTNISGTHAFAHHLVIGKPPPGMVTDHINGDGLDIRRANLRFVTHSENIQAAHSLKPFKTAVNSTDGVQIIRKRMADGTVKTYYYDRKRRGAAQPPNR